MLDYIINEGKPWEKKVTCPCCWEETKLRVYQDVMTKITKEDNNVKVFSTLVDYDYEQLWSTADELLDAEIYRATAFVFNQAPTFRNAPVPEEITVAGRTVSIPKKLHKLTIGQNFILRQALARVQREEKFIETLISLAASVYLQPLVDQAPFDFERAKELEKEILEMNIFDIFPVGFFLLKKLNDSGTSGWPQWSRKIHRSIKNKFNSLSKRVSRSWPTWRSSHSSNHTRALSECCLALFNWNHSTRSCHSLYCGPREPTTRLGWTG